MGIRNNYCKFLAPTSVCIKITEIREALDALTKRIVAVPCTHLSPNMQLHTFLWTGTQNNSNDTGTLHCWILMHDQGLVSHRAYRACARARNWMGAPKLIISKKVYHFGNFLKRVVTFCGSLTNFWQ